ncbi:UDP-3-O-(3-hydroxymyristoyl)glucosamine N-acyltransferase [Neisseria canis]|uniref:UDP-3-O-acylglucosamine N-acyltransferase n=1 Tax=Neisseria canis TaxID=493 RepID=A0A448D592_9NEIS|nr:UDP-3-O-(3-hydroxymyristoyl)glucosamine N-acyltransferase [Neisseria canis]OSI12457.1 UDP-3-O-(3-hydroxymyristoyl)glucosamine N-acyltransferase [Neisseria canis]VEE99041.1 UDP-3-O-[3-hydroxymyristoyl] glucosamine N-acyltransferase [Neisseria canis]
MASYTLSQIVAELGGEWRGEDIAVSGVRPLDSAEANHIGFLANPKYKATVAESSAGAVIVSPKVADEFNNRNLIIAADPYLYFAKTARLFSPIVKANSGIHPTAVIEPSATVPAGCEIGAHAYIGANTVLGEGCRILAGAVVEHDCTLGNEVVIHPNAVIYHGCTLGNRVEIHGGSVIGADGFGLAFAGDSWFKIPQTGGVTLHDDVEIGANSMIDRGAMTDTVVGRGTKIDNQVQIGHNCQIGEHTVIAACAGISGSTKIGSYCIIGGAAMFVGHIEIADKTTIGGGTAVTHSIKEPGHYATCYPMQTHKEWARNAVHIRHLSEMSKKIKQLEQDIAAMQHSNKA